MDIVLDESYGIDHVKVMVGMGAFGRRVSEPEEIAPALEWEPVDASEPVGTRATVATLGE